MRKIAVFCRKMISFIKKGTQPTASGKPSNVSSSWDPWSATNSPQLCWIFFTAAPQRACWLMVVLSGTPDEWGRVGHQNVSLDCMLPTPKRGRQPLQLSPQMGHKHQKLLHTHRTLCICISIYICHLLWCCLHNKAKPDTMDMPQPSVVEAYIAVATHSNK